jgi:hypothetical protein
MRYLKLFENVIPLQQPSYKKGEVIIWSDQIKNKDVDYDFAKKLLDRVGLKLVGEPYDGGFLVKCEPGKEVESAQMAISRFPEFFDSYQREDIRMPFIWNKIEEITDKVASIEDFFERTDRKFVNIKKFNAYIDDIINELDKLKIN